MKRDANRPFMTIKETAEEFHFPPNTIKRLMDAGAFPIMKVGKRRYIMRDVFKEFLRKGGCTE